MPSKRDIFWAKNGYKIPIVAFCILMLCYIPVRGAIEFTPSLRQISIFFVVFIPIVMIPFLYSALFAVKQPQTAMEHDFFYHGYAPVHKFKYDVITPETERWWRLYVAFCTVIVLTIVGFWFLSFGMFLIYGA